MTTATAPMNVGKYVEGLLKLVKETEEFSGKCAKLGIMPIDLKQVKDQIRERLEDLPIHEEDGVKKAGFGVMYFILIGGEWWPVYHGRETKPGWIEWRFDYEHGVESGVSRPYYWAHCTADGTVNYHWFDEDEDVEGAAYG